jgi:cytochrome c oxidase assembly protein subunit 15
MRARRPSHWLNRFAWFTAIATLLLICSGGMVTSKSAGLAVPDWPTTFGYNMFLFPVSQWVGGIFFEHTHRLIASTVGLLTVVLALWLWCMDERGWVRRLGIYAVVGVILQGVLGGLRVTLLKDEIGIFHACLAQAFLGLIVFIALVTTDFWRGLSAWKAPARSRRWLRLALLTTAAIYLQLALGATMRHQHRDLSILDFPTAYGSWLPDTSAPTLTAINNWRDARGLSDVTAFQIWLQMAHRFGAILVALGVISCAVRFREGGPEFPALRRLTLLWCALLAGQITLGAWTIWSNKAADIATAHVAVGATMLSLGVIVCAICGRVSRSSQTGSPARSTEGALAI